ncbi:MAG: polyprenyl synthetase family protein [Pseudomonadales bacterium]
MSDVLARYQSRIEEHLDHFLPSRNIPPQLAEAMRYAVFNGGKRVRPTLTYLAAEALGAKPGQTDRTACAIEFIHTYSLIHDDLPAMDDDELRRGKPTCHMVYGDALAILAGDALQTLAFELIAADAGLAPEQRVEIVSTLAIASGADGMVGGQVIDLASENKSIDAAMLEQMHRRKTGALISASVVCGAIVAGASEDDRHALERYGHDLGLAFQVKDDILDETGDTNIMGKPAGSDQSRRKSTFVSVYGLNEAIARLDDLRQDAITALAPFGEAGRSLQAMAEFVANRDH